MLVEHVRGGEVLLFFGDGVVKHVRLPGVRDARKARVVDRGMGLDPGDGRGEFGLLELVRMRGRTVYRFDRESRASRR